MNSKALQELEKIKKARTYGLSRIDQMAEEKKEDEEQDYGQNFAEDDIDDFVVDEKPSKRIKVNEVEDPQDFRDKHSGPLMRSFKNSKQQQKPRQTAKLDPKQDLQSKALMEQLLQGNLAEEAPPSKFIARDGIINTLGQNSQAQQLSYGISNLSNPTAMEEETPANKSSAGEGEIDAVVAEYLESLSSVKTSQNINFKPSREISQNSGVDSQNFSQRSVQKSQHSRTIDDTKMIDINSLFATKLRTKDQVFQFQPMPDPFTQEKILEPETGLEVYWTDMCRNPKDHSIVHIFGKTQKEDKNGYSSVCLNILNNERTIYVFKKPECSSVEKVESELRNKLDDSNLFRGKYKLTPMKKKYSFELDIAQGSNLDCVEIRYSFKLPDLRISQEGKTYKGVIGNTYTAEELLMLQNRLQGPSWLRILQKTPVAKEKKNSYCKHEFSLENLDSFEILQEPQPNPPALKAVSVSLRTEEEANGGNKICSLVMLEIKDFDLESTVSKRTKLNPFVYSLNPDSSRFKRENLQKKLQKDIFMNCFAFDDEKSMLVTFVQQFNRLDPDLIIGHDVLFSFWDVLISRLAQLRIDSLSSLSRLRREYRIMRDSLKLYRGGRVRNFTLGRLNCDTFLSAKELMKEVEYSLGYLSKKLFDLEYTLQLPPAGNPYNSVLLTADNCLKAAYLSQLVCDKLEAIQLTKQLTNVAGCLWVHSLENQRAVRNEMLLMHVFYRYGYVLPDKYRLQKTNGPGANKKSKKAKYKGGYVIEPKSALYNDAILLVDFNSLYPSIIREFDICFTTVKRQRVNLDFYFNEDARDTYEKLYQPPEEVAQTHNMRQIEKGKRDVCILPQIVKSLINKRKAVKRELKSASGDKKNALNTKQLAYKLIANSIYGCLGFGSSRFYARPLAALVTYYGRDILRKSAEKVESMNYEVVYGDTDSLMVNSRTQDVFKAIEIGVMIKTEINKQYKRKILEIEIDGIFKTLLLHKKKNTRQDVSQIFQNL